MSKGYFRTKFTAYYHIKFSCIYSTLIILETDFGSFLQTKADGICESMSKPRNGEFHMESIIVQISAIWYMQNGDKTNQIDLSNNNVGKIPLI